ncbi:hypothetical protein BWI97_15860 [Siphonobacter sp. BAB-5405]|nr:hypothetical protein BWI97_15860 [Siphonobacter sp. BAB-5405]
MTANEARQKAQKATTKASKDAFDQKEYDVIIGKISEAAEAEKFELIVYNLSGPVQRKLIGMGYMVSQVRTPGFPITIKW